MILKIFFSFVLVAYVSAGTSFSIGGLGGGLGSGLGGGLGERLGGGLGGGLRGGLIGELGGLSGGLNLGGGGGGTYKDIDYYTIPKYEYQYAVKDPKKHDVHQQKEERHGDKVVGEYSLEEPDGTIRIVKYTADKENGFNAIVERKGHAIHPQHYKSYII